MKTCRIILMYCPPAKHLICMSDLRVYVTIEKFLLTMVSRNFSQYRGMLRELNSKQRAIVMFHRNWCKKAVIALKEGKPVEPYHVFLSGPGGV